MAKSAIMLGGGKSLGDVRQKDLRLPTLALNHHAIAAGLDVDMVVACDPPVHRHYEKYLPDPRPLKLIRAVLKDAPISPDNNRAFKDCPNVEFFESSTGGDHKTYFTRPTVYWGDFPFPTSVGHLGIRATMISAFRLLWNKGFRVVYLVGVDMVAGRGMPSDNTSFSRSMAQLLSDRLKALAPVFEKAGLKVFNATPQSALKCFPFRSVPSSGGA